MTRALLLVLAALLAAPAAAQARIVPQQGMKGVRLGMTVAQVQDRLGEPSRSEVVDNEIIGRVRELRYGLTTSAASGRAARSPTSTSRRPAASSGSSSAW